MGGFGDSLEVVVRVYSESRQKVKHPIFKPAMIDLQQQTKYKVIHLYKYSPPYKKQDQAWRPRSCFLFP